MLPISSLPSAAGTPGPIRIQSQPSERIGLGDEPKPIGAPFASTLREAVQTVDQAQKASDAQVEGFIAGEIENVHEVMISMNKAELHFQLMTEVRNKLLDSYQELMRMQV